MGGVVEVWKEIAGTNGAYEVSSLGRVRSMPRRVSNPAYVTRGKKRSFACSALPTWRLRIFSASHLEPL
jgi:hypothetical protein